MKPTPDDKPIESTIRSGDLPDQGQDRSIWLRDVTNTTNQQPLTKTLRSVVDHPPKTSSGVFLNTCIFCNKERKKRKGVEVPLGCCTFDDPELNVKWAADILEDSILQAKIGDVDFRSKQVKYHHVCKRDYLNKAHLKQKERLMQNSQCHESLNYIFSYISTTIIDNKQPEFLTSLHDRFKQHYQRVSSIQGQPYSTANRFADKIKREFGDRIRLDKTSKKDGFLVYSSGMSLEEADNMVKCLPTELHVIKAALQLRKEVMKLRETVESLPSPLTLDVIRSGQTEPPPLLLKFFETLYSGNINTASSEKINRHVKSSASDVVYIVSNGHIKPSKHICMGLAMKSMTGSRKIVEILNHLGHSTGYHVTEEFETDLATDISAKREMTPEGIVKSDGLSTSLAWDNYDELTETLSGKGTLHDTVGICYQNESSEIPRKSENSRDLRNSMRQDDLLSTDSIQPGGLKRHQSEPSTSKQQVKKKRKFQPTNRVIEPIKGRPSMKSFHYPLETKEDPAYLPKIDRIDTLWMMSCSFSDDTPMWRGWNSIVTIDSLPKQTIRYMENIQLPPTRLDVVKDTLIRSQQVAKECHQKEIVVHYDLAIAKPALQIQSTEAPRFDNIFICFGPFHIEMTYFACLGHFLDASGGPQILSDTNVLAQGSLNGFLSGRHFNRCKRVHPLLATGVQILHFRQFLQQHGPISESLMTLLNACHDPSPGLLDEVERSTSFSTLLEKYEEFSKLTRSGHHGATAKFWMAYVDLMRIYRLFDRACRTNDLTLFIYALGRMCAIFFAANRPNYSRWMVLYHLRLLNMNPSTRKILESGALSVRRTSKNFARSPVDLTLEQTVNKDAASRHTGIVAFNNNESARKRWMVTRPVRAAIVGHLLETAGMKHQAEEGSKELQPFRIRRDNQDLSKIVRGFETTMNPFSAESNSNKLFCIATGRAASDEVANDILRFEEKGADWCQQFRIECKEDKARFKRPIKRRKVKTFSNDAVKMRMPTKDKRVKEVCCTRDLFGRLLFVATSKKVDLRLVLSYPLLTVPLALCHFDGFKNKTDKAVLMKKLEGNIEQSTPKDQPDKADFYFLDAMFFFRTLPMPLPSSFAGVARLVLAEACKLAGTVHLVCDRYDVHPSIKDLERASRGDYEGVFNISGGMQKRPSDFNQSLKSASFKTAFIHFLSNEWHNDEYVDILGNHTMYLALDKVCYKYQVVDRKMTKILVQELKCNHEEADTRILLHARYVADNSYLPPIIAVRASDSDIFILLLHHAKRLKVAGIWMDVGLSSDNSRRSVNISTISEQLGQDICDAILGFHAFTGCDYTASFMRKGKDRPFQLMKKEKEFLTAFQSLGNTLNVSADVMKTLETFVCRMYGQRRETEVNEARYVMFKKLFSPRDINRPLESLKSSEPSCLPPCKKVLLQKIRRANYITMMWKNAIVAIPIDLEPQHHGWKLSDDKQTMAMLWFLGSNCPVQLNAEEVEIQEEDEPDDNEMTDVVFSDEEEQEDDDLA